MQKNVNKILRSLKNIHYDEQLRETELLSLELGKHESEKSKDRYLQIFDNCYVGSLVTRSLYNLQRVYMNY